MRILFWATSILAFLAYFFSAVLFIGVKSSPEGGMAMLLFLPMIAAGILCSAIAAFVRYKKKFKLNSLENGVGLVGNILMMLAMFLMIMIFAGVI